MFRLLWHVVPDSKNIWIGLTTVYGIGRPKSKEILSQLGIDPFKKVKDLSEDEQKKISDFLKEMTLESDLKKEISSSIKRLKEVKCYRGIRHNLGLPVRGQVTRKRAKTAKKLLWRSRVRPVLKK
jgi:small subunit ribosomal protein S13